MRIIRRLMCWLGAHQPRDGVERDGYLLWSCRHCNQLVTGGMAERRRR